MGLSEIASGLEVTTEQRDRGVATVDQTDADLATRLAEYEDELPCTPEAAATVVETHTAGVPVGESGHEACLSPVTAAKTLYLLGMSGLSPLGPTGREVLRDWLDGSLSRSEAKTLVNTEESEFALATFLETHDPIDGAAETVEDALSTGEDAAVRKRDRLGETMSSVDDLL